MAKKGKKQKYLVAKVEAPSDTITFDEQTEDAFEIFKEEFSIEIIKNEVDELVFDMIGCEPPLANALRRILLAHVPTMAIEKVYIHNNTSIIQDEVLSHRLGLIPINANPKEFTYRIPDGEDEKFSTDNTLVFNLDITCTKTPSGEILNSNVTSNDLIWVPQEDQQEIYGEIKPVFQDILIAKLVPGQTIHLEAYCEKGIGKTHAKWSPCSTAYYRLLPKIKIKNPIIKGEAERLKNLCPMNVFDIEDSAAIVSRPRNCTVCRECIREENNFQNDIELNRVKNHFIFSIESVGMMSPTDLFREAIKILMEKCVDLETGIALKSRF